jgi:DNA-binding NtrC family response regulator
VKSILIVLNEEILAKGIAVALLDYFQSVHIIKNPFEVLEKINAENIEVIITDLQFNTMDSDYYLKNLLNKNPLPKIFIVEDEDPKILHDENRIKIIKKPITIKSIIEAILK